MDTPCSLKDCPPMSTDARYKWIKAGHFRNIFGILPEYSHHTSFFNDTDTVLPSWSGYVIVVGFSFFFICMSLFLVWVEKKFAGAEINSEQFSTAGRSLGSALIAVDVVSHWTWAGWIITAATWSVLYGVSATMWSNVGGIVCIWVFAILSIELKIRAPKAHTVLEIIRVRWGTTAHLVYFFFVGLTIWCATINMTYSVLTVTQQLTNANVYVMAFMIPAGVVCYAAVGGLKATFTTSYVHTVIIYGVLTLMMFKVFAGFGLLGNIDLVYDRLVAYAEHYPADGNRNGSYLTTYSSGGFQLCIVWVLGCFAFLFIDQSYWQSAIAARPTAAIRGYILGAILMFPIGYSLNMIGIAPLALDLPLTEDEVFNGAASAAFYFVLLGRFGPMLVVVVAFMAVTSSGAGEMLAISSLFTFDVWRQYIHPKASTKELVLVARVGVIVWGLIMGVSLSVLYAGKVNLVLINLAPNTLLCSAIPGISAALLWKRGTKWAAIISASVGLVCGGAAWVLFARFYYNTLSVQLLSNNYPILVGSLVNFFSAAILMWVISLVFPAPDFKWEMFNEGIELADNSKTGLAASGPDSIEALKKARPVVYWGTAIFAFILFIAWPALSVWQPVYNRGNFWFWCVFGIAFQVFGSIVATLAPIIESWGFIKKVTFAILSCTPIPDYVDEDEPEKETEMAVQDMNELAGKIF